MVKAERYIFLKNIDLVLIHSYVNGLMYTIKVYCVNKKKAQRIL